MGKSIAMLLAMVAAVAASAATLDLHTDVSDCRIDLDGAQIISFRLGSSELLWNDSPPQSRANDWAHGGIPICWPRFGVDETGAIHGIAWRSTFSVRHRHDSSVRSNVLLALQKGDAQLEYAITLTDALTLEMTTLNAGTNSIACSFGFHPYLRTAERSQTVISGLDGFSFEDDPSRVNPMRGTWHGPIRLEESIDRIFSLPTARPCSFTIDDNCGRSRIVVASEGASHVNVWNPGPEKLCPGVVPGDEWRRFVCVEPILVGGADGKPVAIPPGERRTLKMTIRADRRNDGDCK